MKTVNFTEMKSGTKEEYLLLDKYEKKYIGGTAGRILNFMKGLTLYKKTIAAIIPITTHPCGDIQSNVA